MRVLYRENALIALISLFVVGDNISTAFIPDARRQPLSHSNIRDTRLYVTSPPSNSADNLPTLATNTNTRKDKRTTELRAATGISLSSDAPSIAATAPQESNDGGLGVLFLNLGGPTKGEDVEGTSRGWIP